MNYYLYIKKNFYWISISIYITADTMDLNPTVHNVAHFSCGSEHTQILSTMQICLNFKSSELLWIKF